MEPPGRLPNSLGNDEHSAKALYFLSFSFIFHFLSLSFIFVHFRSFSFIFFDFLLFSFIFFHFLLLSFIFFHFVDFSFIFFHLFSFFHFLSFSFIFIFFHFLSCSFFLLVLVFFSGAQNRFFASIASRFPVKALMSKKIFLGPSRGYPIGPFFSLVYFVMCFFISVFFFNVFLCFVFFPLFFLFSFFLYFPFVFLFRKMFLPFSFCFSFSFSRVLKICGGTPGFLGKSAHSELALFALYLLVVTFPCGIVHILVMIRLRVVFGGRRVGQVPPSYQNRQISALDETADAPQSSLFFLLSALRSPLSSLLSPSQFYKYLSLFSRNRVARRSLAGRSRVFVRAALLFS